MSYRIADTAPEIEKIEASPFADITSINLQIVDRLPAEGQHGVIYLVEGAHDEYMWVTFKDGSAHYEQLGITSLLSCPACGTPLTSETPYCPWCGAKMEGEEEK